jgi:hypothetical protein
MASMNQLDDREVDPKVGTKIADRTYWYVLLSSFKATGKVATDEPKQMYQLCLNKLFCGIYENCHA